MHVLGRHVDLSSINDCVNARNARHAVPSIWSNNNITGLPCQYGTDIMAKHLFVGMGVSSDVPVGYFPLSWFRPRVVSKINVGFPAELPAKPESLRIDEVLLSF